MHSAPCGIQTLVSEEQRPVVQGTGCGSWLRLLAVAPGCRSTASLGFRCFQTLERLELNLGVEGRSQPPENLNPSGDRDNTSVHLYRTSTFHMTSRIYFRCRLL